MSWTSRSRVREALADICDTFVPGTDGRPSASHLGVADAFLTLAATNLRAAERRQLQELLSLWDTRLLTMAAGGGFRRFGDLPQEDRERVLLSWCDSRLPQRRTAFQALRKATASLAYMLPAADGRNPAWGSMGYPGPPGRTADPAPKEIQPLAVDRETTLDCDVCVVGSGAGGGTAAAVLADAGLDVVVIEAGDYVDDGDFDGGELDGYLRLYLGGAALATADQSVGLYAGACLGGGTVVNFSTAFRTPDEIRAEWARHGVGALDSDDFTNSLDAVWDRLGVTTDYSRPSRREHVMKRGLESLGWHVDLMPRNVRGCDEAVCGYSPFGCLAGAKQSTTKTWLVDAWRRGARMLVRTRAERVVVEHGRARGVEARTGDGHRVKVRARAVVVAAGAVHTPALLRRSGLGNRNIGRHLRLHPVTGVAGVFDEEVRPWEGVMQAVYSDELADLHAGYGMKLESAPFHPSALAIYAPWRGARQHEDLMGRLAHLVPVGLLLRDSSEGEVRTGRDGEPVVHYRLNDFDIGHVRTGLDGAARVLEAAGATSIFSAHKDWVTYEPGRGRGRQGFLEAADRCGWGAGQCVFTSFHIMGSARMGPSPRDSACNPEGETWDARGVFVCDGSTFPTASGVNPMITIEAIAHLNASRLAAALA
ncbi:MAG TPA: GMC family oxidoreductase N-terminal domain-containing protein [Acidimicrobiales bacterium]|nr:GMC family oxidoreductase N-terminal domain-containing protein [Acidimicrobiales bacterium]